MLCSAQDYNPGQPGYQQHIWQATHLGVPSSRCVYLIEAQGPMCKLTIEHYDIPEGLEDVAEGWAREFSSLKSYLETGEALKAAMGGH